MSEVFLKIVNMSISAGWIVLAVILLRLLLKKAPKWITVLLWGLVAVRLLCPFSIESILSLMPSGETISPEIMMEKVPQIDSGVPIVNTIVNPYISESFAPNPDDSANPLQIIVPLLAIAWVVGIVGMLLYTAISYLRLRRKIGTAVLLKDNIYQSESVVSPFVLGIIKPKIYLPFNMANKDLEHVIAHENAHIRRKDHLWKPLGFLILSVYWFNPLMWLGYILLCRDIELACDEKVIKEFDTLQKADYSEALLNCSVNRRIIAACPLAFGEVGVKNRVKTILNYKKPAFWIVVVAIVTSIAVAVCFLTNPKKDNKDGNVNTPIISSQETGSDLKGVSLEIVNNGFHLPRPYIEVDWINETSDKILFGDEFNILYWQNGSWKSCQNEEMYWHAIGYIMEPKKSGTKLYELAGFNFGKAGKYRFEAPFFIDGKSETEYTAWVEFSLTSDANFAESFYFDPMELLYSDKEYTEVVSAEELASYTLSSELELIGPQGIYSSTTLGTLQSIDLNEDTFDSRFRDKTNIISSIKKNNRRAWQLHGTTKQHKPYFYILLEQLDGSFYLGFGPAGYDADSPENSDFSYFNAFYKVKHYLPRGLSTANNLSIASMTRLKEIYPHFFDISTNGGLTVHIWQTSQNNYLCYLTNSSDKSFEKDNASYGGVSISEMRAILTTYNLGRDKITLNPIKNPLINYEYEINSKYKKNLEELFWQDTNLLFATVTGACNRDGINKFDALNKDKLDIRDKTHLPVYKFDTLKEFEDFDESLEIYDPILPDDYSYFGKTKEYFDKEFFSTHSLVITWVYTGSGSSRVDVHSLEFTEDFLNVNVIKTKAGMTDDVGYWFVTVAVPKAITQNCTEFDADFGTAKAEPILEDVKRRLPNYFDLDTKNGLDVYFWVKGDKNFYCGLLPTKQGGYTEKERLALLKSPATDDEMKVILDYYIKNGMIAEDKISLNFVKIPDSNWTDADHRLTNSMSMKFFGKGMFDVNV